MIYLRRLLILLTPSPVAGCVSIVAAITFGYLLWTELEPPPRQIVTVVGPKGKDVLFDQATFSPDGRTLVFHYAFLDDGEPRQVRRSAIHLCELSTGRQIVLSEQMGPPIVFAPDGKRIAGFAQDTVIVWDRDTGKELKRHPVNAVNRRKHHPLNPALRRKDFEPLLAFMADDLILWNDWSLDENEKVQRHTIALSTQKPWNGDVNEFDCLHIEQQSQPLRSVVSADGKLTLSRGIGGFDLSDAKGKVIQSIAYSDRFDGHPWAGVSPDAKALILNGRIWRPLQAAYAGLQWVYSDVAKEPAAVNGALLVDFESGAEIAFLQVQRPHFDQFGVTPDSKSFVMIEMADPFSSPALTVKIYDWPLARPWWRIVGGALLAFVALVLISKAWRWFRGPRKSDEEDAPLTRPPWETDEATVEDAAEK